MSVAIFTLVALAAARSAAAATCYSPYYGYYSCSGLSYGARVGIGIACAAALVFLILACTFWRRRQVRAQYAKFRPPPLPTSNNAAAYGANPYANNPPPPAPGSYNAAAYSNYGQNGYGNDSSNPSIPQPVYQPSNAGYYGMSNLGAKNANLNNGNGVITGDAAEQEHGYEWEQARESERLEAERQRAEAAAGAPPPPGYDVATSTTGSTGTYAPPAGPPPIRKNGGAI